MRNLRYRSGNKRKAPAIGIMISIFVLAGFGGFAQAPDSAHKQEKKLYNTIKINLTSFILYENAFQFSYEREIKRNQTLNVFLGSQQLPGNWRLNLDSTTLGGVKKKSGYSVGVDYRFYLSKENKYEAPHGVYLAPYVSFHNFSSERTLTFTDSLGPHATDLKTGIGFMNLGAQMGYQFVFGKRWTVDVVFFAPALTYYNFKAKLGGDIPNFDENEAAKKIIDALKQKFPLLGDLSGETDVNAGGVNTFWSVGFRYAVNLGFRF